MRNRSRHCCRSQKKGADLRSRLELKSGQPVRLFQLAHRFNTIVPLRIEPASKAARGYDLANDSRLNAPVAAPVHIHPAMSVRTPSPLLHRLVLLMFWPAPVTPTRARRPEGIHELRVSIRRMRAAFSVFRGAMPENHRFRIGDELRVLQRKLGKAREWDVLVEETVAACRERLRRHRSSQKLVGIAQAKCVEGHKSAHAALRDPSLHGPIIAAGVLE